MIDNNHQGNLTAAVGLTPAIQRALQQIKDGLDLIPANKRLADVAARLQVMQLSQYIL